MEIVNASLKDQFPGLIINFVLDGSGSMASRKDATISAVNEYIKSQQISKQAQRKGQIYLTLTTFSDKSRLLYSCKEISEVPELNGEAYITEGWTALNDAVGSTINSVSEAIKNWDQKPAIVTVILTDGQENSSREFSTAQVKKLIEDKQKEGWVFIFLAEGLNVETVGASMGIKKAMCRAIHADDMGVTMQALAGSTMCFADSLHLDAKSLECASANFFDAAKEKWEAVDQSGQTARQFDNLDISQGGSK